MLETELRDLFERQASGDQPPAAISGREVIRQGRSRLRVRHAGVVVAPLVAAAAVAAVVVPIALPGALPGKPRPHQSITPTGPVAPKSFDPARLYPSFGWLPAGTHVTGGMTGTVSQTLSAQNVSPGPPNTLPAWILAVYAGGQCSTVGGVLHCAGPTALWVDPPLTTQLPDINGLPAYWAARTVRMGTADLEQGTVVFEYARDGWAELTEYAPDGGPALTSEYEAEAVRIAQRITFGTSTASPIFPVQLTGLPGWQLRSAGLAAAQGPLQALKLAFASGAAEDAPGPPVPGTAENYPLLTATVAGPGSTCAAAGQPPFFSAGQSTTTVIAGYAVTITRGRVDLGSDVTAVAVQELCAADADGLAIDLLVYGSQPVIDVTQFFAHLRLLGPDPAHWTTKPIA